MTTRALLASALLVLGAPTPQDVRAQLGPITGYGLTVGTLSDSSPFAEANATLFQRLRLMLRPRLGPIDFDIAYEQAIQFRVEPTLIESPLGAPTATTWLPLQWTIADDDHATWSHRFDRLSASASFGKWELSAGREAISWATTLFLTPADPFAPFDPSDPFREYRAGVDVARIQYFPGALSELDLVVRPADTRDGTQMSALLRGRMGVGSTALSAWAGLIYEGPGAAVGGSQSLGAFELRAEASVREDPDSSGAVLRLTVGLDRRFTVASRDLYVVAEFQHDGFGAADSDELIEVALSDPFSRGELQVLGRDEVALSGAYQIHPLWSVDLLTLISLVDGSGLVAPAGSYSVGTDVSLRGGVFLSYGPSGGDIEGGLRSEYGSVPASAYLSLTWFF